jgi:hypothetical protein
MRDVNSGEPRRLVREKRTLQAMARLYCRAHHGTRGSLCPDCQLLCDSRYSARAFTPGRGAACDRPFNIFYLVITPVHGRLNGTDMEINGTECCAGVLARGEPPAYYRCAE